MKLNLILIMSFILSISVYAQTDCDNDVRTDWTNPNNNALPVDLTHPLPTGDIRYKNYTNWFPLTPGGNFDDYDLSNMVWSGTPLLEMDNIWSTSIPHYNYINQSPPPLPINGWELLLVNIGRYPNNVDVLDQNETFQAIPYIVIYNRYTGVIRVFLNFGLDNQVGNGPDAVQIELSIFDGDNPNPTKNGLLRLYEGKDTPLDQSTKVKHITGVAKATNAQRQWMSADFQIAYDPCVCYYPSKLQLTFNQIQQESLVLAGRSLSADDDLINGQLKINPYDFLTGFDANGNDVANGGGILMYKGLQNVVDDYIARYERYKSDLLVVNQHNKVVEHNLGALKMLKYMLTAVFTYGISGNAIDVSAAQATDWFASMSTEYGKFIQKANGTFDIEKILGIAKKVLGSSAKTYIEHDFEKLPLPQEPDKARLPRVTFTEMKFQGQITQQQLKGGPWFYTPGTYRTQATKILQSNGTYVDPILNTPYNYPVYNDALGTFALLKTPKVSISKRVMPNTVTTKQKGIIDGAGWWTTAFYKSWTTEYQLRLSEDLKYAINTTLDIDNYEIKAAFRFKAKNKILFLNGQEYNTFINPDYTTNVFSTNQDVDTYDMLRSFSNTPFTNDVFDGYGPVTGNWCVNKVMNGNQYSLIPYECFRDEKPEFQTPFIPISAFYNTPAGIGFVEEFIQFSGTNDYLIPGNQGLDLDFYDIELVLMIDTKYGTLNSKGLNNTNLQTLSYEIPLSNVTWTNTNLITNLNTNFDLREQNENIELGQTHFSGQAVKNCKLDESTSTYECRAWKDIVISGDITSQEGYTVNIIAGNKIETEPTSFIGPTVNLYIQKALNEDHPMPLSTQTEVTNFCKGINGQPAPYKANQASIMINSGNEETQSSNQTQEVNSEWDVDLYPNPSSGVTRLKLNNMPSEKVFIQVLDVTGKLITSETNTLNDSLIEMNMSSFDKGTYFIKVVSDKGTKTKRLVIR